MMNNVLLIVSLAVIIIAIPRILLRYKRFKHGLKLESVYEEMEMFFVRKGIPLRTRYIELLKIHKNIVVNPELLDIQLLLLIKKSTEKHGTLSGTKEWYAETVESLGPDFIHLVRLFNEHSDKLISYSFFKPDFVWFTLRLLVTNMVTKRVSKIREDIKYAFENEAPLLKAGRDMRMAA